MQDTHEYTNTQKYLIRGGVEAVALCPDVAIVTGDGGSGDHPAGDQLHKSRIYQKGKTS